MLRSVAEQVLGSSLVLNTAVDTDGNETRIEYDFGKAFDRLTVVDAIVRYNENVSAEQLADESFARQMAKDLGVKVKDSWGLWQSAHRDFRGNRRAPLDAAHVHYRISERSVTAGPAVKTAIRLSPSASSSLSAAAKLPTAFPS